MTNNVIKNIGFSDYQTDGTSKIRVQNSITVGDYKIINSDNNSNLISYSGTGTFTTNINRVNMSVTSGQFCVAQTKVYHHHTLGKSSLIKLKVSGFGSASNIEKSIGYYSSTAVSPFATSLDGFRLFKSTSDVYSIEIWRNGTKIIDILRSDWADKLDGSEGSSNPSGMNINFDFSNEFVFDFCYMGGRALGCYVLYNGEFRLFAVYYHANTDPVPMLNSPNKPLRWEIRSTTGTGNMNLIGGEMALDGYAQLTPSSVEISSSVLGLTLPNPATTYALCAVRKKTTARDIFAFIEIFEGAIKTNDFIKFSLILNPTVAGVFNFTDLANSPFQTATGTILNTVTGGIVMPSTFASLNMNNARAVNNILLRLGATVNDTMDTVVLGATPTLGSNNTNVTAYMGASWFN